MNNDNEQELKAEVLTPQMMMSEDMEKLIQAQMEAGNFSHMPPTQEPEEEVIDERTEEEKQRDADNRLRLIEESLEVLQIPLDTIIHLKDEELRFLIDARQERKKLNTLSKWNIKSDKETKMIAENVLTNVSEVLSRTFGPFGSHTIIEDSQRNHHMTKDGFTVLKKINFVDPTMNAINKMLYDIAFNLVIKVGDGSTSSIVAAKELYTQLQDTIESNPSIRKKEIFDTISYISGLLVKKIESKARPISDDFSELEAIATISTNNDKELGKLIKDLYKVVSKHGKINIALSTNDKTHYVTSSGFKFRATMLDKILINDKKSAVNMLKDNNGVKVLMIKGGLSGDMREIGLLINHILTNGHKLVIIANSFSESATSFFSGLFSENDVNLLNTNLNILYMPLLNDNDIELYEELAVYTKATIIRCDGSDVSDIEEDDEFELTDKLSEKLSDKNISNNKNPEFNFERDCVKRDVLGTVTSVLSKDGKGENVILTGGDYTSDKVAEIKKNLQYAIDREREENAENLTEEIIVSKLESRLLNFSEEASIATLYVGGKNQMEKETDRYLIEDAIQACESALKYGYNIGGNLIIPISVDEILEENKELTSLETSILDLIRHSFREVYKTVYKNKYSGDYDELKFSNIFENCVIEETTFNLITEEYDNSTVINSARTDIEILRSTLSIISLLVLSNQYISLISDNYMSGIEI